MANGFQWVPFWGADNLITSFTVKLTNRLTGESEDLALSTMMKLRRAKPARSNSGNKIISVDLLTWSSKGYSPMLQNTIEYKLSRGVMQNKSIIEGHSANSDFPASMTFNALFDVYVGRRLVASGISGTARASNLSRIPPDGDDLFTVNKGVSFDDYDLITKACASRFLPTTGQKLIIQAGVRFGLVPSYFSSYLDD
jgi:hypothetical protein